MRGTTQDADQAGLQTIDSQTHHTAAALITQVSLTNGAAKLSSVEFKPWIEPAVKPTVGAQVKPGLDSGHHDPLSSGDRKTLTNRTPSQ
jgi:hypothetical protein